MNELKGGRARLGINQDQLADKMNVTRTTVSNWENRKQIPNVSQIVKLSSVLQIEIGKLMDFFNKDKEE